VNRDTYVQALRAERGSIAGRPGRLADVDAELERLGAGTPPEAETPEDGQAPAETPEGQGAGTPPEAETPEHGQTARERRTRRS